jgi:phenylalanine-4-hydroxylase
MYEPNEILDRLPRHLMELVIEQPYNEYTAQDHAVWRYVMHRNVQYLSQVAHGSYLDGLRRTGISIESIPHMYGMNRILKEIGWAAVAVDGFIPPAGFMEFQAYKVLVIAADIRPVDQINYTPSPDVIHEAAGHAPIIADEEYAEYLRLFGEIGYKAFSSAMDYKLYEAVRHLSILKADPYSPKADIESAEKSLALIEHNLGNPSEMARIRNLHWWTVEYGLIGDLKKPKIYGAGLLSSIGESRHCMTDRVKKIPYTLDAADVGFDITTMQPQLFVTPDFQHLTGVLQEFAGQMALRKGGLYGIRKAIESANTATCVYSSGLQVSGTFTGVIEMNGEPVYLKTFGPTALSDDHKHLDGHGKEYHAHGFGSPIGKLKESSKPLELMDAGDLAEEGIWVGKYCLLEFRSGVTVSGKLEHILNYKGKNILMTFSDCKVVSGDQILFEPSWGTYDMAIGESIVSAFSGPADPDAFGLRFPVPKEKTHKIVHFPQARRLHLLYQKVRDVRENRAHFELLPVIWDELIASYPDEWLLYLELFELSRKESSLQGLAQTVFSHLERLKTKNEETRALIDNGLALIGKNI